MSQLETNQLSFLERALSLSSSHTKHFNSPPRDLSGPMTLGWYVLEGQCGATEAVQKAREDDEKPQTNKQKRW